ncbi:MAG: methylated-DNA--[protein]-cysteine S-methyltransferase [Clostridia bacterium]|jgi:methylated-DNA-[protein]-cysteine S-methyltransferase|nr:methylated-DNA--[protein]-cysteine S-methyltransferase [Clostridia bacterium]
MNYTRFNTEICEIILVGNEEGITNLHLNTGEGKREFRVLEEWIYNDNFFDDAKKQIYEYLEGNRKDFNIKLNIKGTKYQRRVWDELRKIPYGEVYTYKEIASKLGNEKASRAVGMANSKNPIPLIVLCHRVVGSNGKLTGFAHGLKVKKELINLEYNNKGKDN